MGAPPLSSSPAQVAGSSSCGGGGGGDVERAARELELARRVARFERPRWDQSTYWGRVQHFAQVTHPLNSLASDVQLLQARALVQSYRRGQEPAGTSEEQVWRAQHLAESAYHPDTGQRTNVLGRMCFQAPGNALLSAAMLTWGLRSTGATLFLQWVNQSYMALVNYSNRNATRDGDDDLLHRMVGSYFMATGGSFAAAAGLRHVLGGGTGIAAKLVPMAAVAAATAINVPMTRYNELSCGVSVGLEDGTCLDGAPSYVASQIAVGSVCVSRILNATSDLLFPPLLVGWAQRQGYGWASTPRTQV
jgi:tricarboxylate carrier